MDEFKITTYISTWDPAGMKQANRNLCGRGQRDKLVISIIALLQ